MTAEVLGVIGVLLIDLVTNSSPLRRPLLEFSFPDLIDDTARCDPVLGGVTPIPGRLYRTKHFTSPLQPKLVGPFTLPCSSLKKTVVLSRKITGWKDTKKDPAL